MILFNTSNKKREILHRRQEAGGSRQEAGVRSQESGVRSQESGGDLKISLPSLEIPKNVHFFRYTLQNPCTNFCVYQPL
ncbi:MAG: hypothetical protein ACKPEO_00775, partial [Sphaerospermopsis kisseleviana]